MRILDLYITKVCNLNCEYCYVDLVKDEHSFQYDKFIERIDLLKYDHIKFFWWEPLLRWDDIKKIIISVKSKNKNISFTIVTNWLLLNNNIIIFCMKYNVEIVISMHYKWIKSTIRETSKYLYAKKIIGFSFIFEEWKIEFPYKVIKLLSDIGFINFLFSPELYSSWEKGNLDLLSSELIKLEQLFINNRKINFKWINWEELKNIIKWCEKTIMWKKGDIFLCNRFKDLSKLKEFNYKKIYEKYDKTIDIDNDKNKWFYICPIWWFLDSLNINKNLEKRIFEFRNLNLLFLSFYKKINTIKWKINFLSDNIDEIRFNLTSQCNIRCEYCYVDFKNEVLDEKKAKNIIDFFILQDWNKKNISFFWWEPFLEYNLLTKLVEYSKKIAFKKNKIVNFTIATNFLLVNENKINFLKENNFKVHISLNWIKNTNNNMRDNSTELLLNNLEKYSNIIWKDNIVILLAFSNKEVSGLYSNLEYIYNLWFKNINLEIIFWKKYLWNKLYINLLKRELFKIKNSFFYKTINLINLQKKLKILDISVDWKAWENSFEFNNYDVEFKVKKIFDILIIKIFKN